MVRALIVAFGAIAVIGLSAQAQTPAPAASNENPVQAERNVVTSQLDSACKDEIARGNCSGEKVGKGLRRCIHAAKPISAGCKQALQTGRAEMKAAKGH
jgi:hypothetical protein